MKATILTTAILFAAILGFGRTTYAATKTNEEVTVLNETSPISKIEVHGNVELYLSDGSADQVKVYNSYYANNALVQDEDGVLRITSYTKQKLVVWVTVSDLHNLTAYDNAEVKSFGKLSAIDLKVELFNKATAHLDVDAFAANIKLNDLSKADLTGTITNGELAFERFTVLNTRSLAVSNKPKAIKFDSRDRNDMPELVNI